MLPGRIPNATRYLGAPAGWVPERDGDCAHLAIKDTLNNGQPCMMSSWIPTPDELERINAGASVTLLIMGTVHPPVSLAVGFAPEPFNPEQPGGG